MPSDPVSRRLDRQWFSSAGYDNKFHLLEAISRGLPVAIGVLVDGRVMKGVVGTDEDFVHTATAALDQPLDTLAGGWEEEDRSGIRRAFEEQARSTRERRDEEQAVVARYVDGESMPTIDDLDETDIASFIRGYGTTTRLTLRQVRLETTTGVARIGAVRLERSAISAWWFLESEEGEQVSYAFPQDADG